MTKEEKLLRDICEEVRLHGMETTRFQKLWLSCGVKLEGSELEVANRLWLAKQDSCASAQSIH